jgi:hypothetical protein
LLDFINDAIRSYEKIQEIGVGNPMHVNADEYRGKVRALNEIKFFIKKGEFDN